jgi:hypothetical protein
MEARQLCLLNEHLVFQNLYCISISFDQFDLNLYDQFEHPVFYRRLSVVTCHGRQCQIAPTSLEREGISEVTNCFLRALIAILIFEPPERATGTVCAVSRFCCAQDQAAKGRCRCLPCNSARDFKTSLSHSCACSHEAPTYVFSAPSHESGLKSAIICGSNSLFRTCML